MGQIPTEGEQPVQSVYVRLLKVGVVAGFASPIWADSPFQHLLGTADHLGSQDASQPKLATSKPALSQVLGHPDAHHSFGNAGLYFARWKTQAPTSPQRWPSHVLLWDLCSFSCHLSFHVHSSPVSSWTMALNWKVVLQCLLIKHIVRFCEFASTCLWTSPSSLWHSFPSLKCLHYTLIFAVTITWLQNRLSGQFVFNNVPFSANIIYNIVVI